MKDLTQDASQLDDPRRTTAVCKTTKSNTVKDMKKPGSDNKKSVAEKENVAPLIPFSSSQTGRKSPRLYFGKKKLHKNIDSQTEDLISEAGRAAGEVVLNSTDGEDGESIPLTPRDHNTFVADSTPEKARHNPLSHLSEAAGTNLGTTANSNQRNSSTPSPAGTSVQVGSAGHTNKHALNNDTTNNNNGTCGPTRYHPNSTTGSANCQQQYSNPRTSSPFEQKTSSTKPTKKSNSRSCTSSCPDSFQAPMRWFTESPTTQKTKKKKNNKKHSNVPTNNLNFICSGIICSGAKPPVLRGGGINSNNANKENHRKLARMARKNKTLTANSKPTSTGLTQSATPNAKSKESVINRVSSVATPVSNCGTVCNTKQANKVSSDTITSAVSSTTTTDSGLTTLSFINDATPAAVVDSVVLSTTASSPPFSTEMNSGCLSLEHLAAAQQPLVNPTNMACAKEHKNEEDKNYLSTTYEAMEWSLEGTRTQNKALDCVDGSALGFPPDNQDTFMLEHPQKDDDVTAPLSISNDNSDATLPSPSCVDSGSSSSPATSLGSISNSSLDTYLEKVDLSPESTNDEHPQQLDVGMGAAMEAGQVSVSTESGVGNANSCSSLAVEHILAGGSSTEGEDVMECDTNCEQDLFRTSASLNSEHTHIFGENANMSIDDFRPNSETSFTRSISSSDLLESAITQGSHIDEALGLLSADCAVSQSDCDSCGSTSDDQHMHPVSHGDTCSQVCKDTQRDRENIGVDEIQEEENSDDRNRVESDQDASNAFDALTGTPKPCPDSPMPTATRANGGAVPLDLSLLPLMDSLPTGWSETQAVQCWDDAIPCAVMGDTCPKILPDLTDEEADDMAKQQDWIHRQTTKLYVMLPEHLKPKNFTPCDEEDCTDDEDGLPMPYEEELWNNQHNRDDSAEAIEEENQFYHNCLTGKFLKTVFAKFDMCKQRFNDLATCNQFYVLLECLLLTGKNIQVLTNKEYLGGVIRCMQYNPKFNSRLFEWPYHDEAVSDRCNAVELPQHVADLCTTIHTMQYMKDRVVPCVCDETRYLNFNMHLTGLKGKLVSTVLNEEQILTDVFDILNDSSSDNCQKVYCLQFIKELFELFKFGPADVGTNHWLLLLRTHKMIESFSKLLDSNTCAEINQACIDVCMYLIDEDCRTHLQNHLLGNPSFVHSIVRLYISQSCTEALALQLQTLLPMLMVNPQVEVLPIFYSSCESALNHWIHTFSNGSCNSSSLSTSSSCVEEGVNLTIVNAFLEMTSLCVHHHYRTFQYQSDVCVTKLLKFIALLYTNNNEQENSIVTLHTLVAANKGILSVLHLCSEQYYACMIEHGIFNNILKHFTDGNNLMNSSILTLLHTVLQLDMTTLIHHVYNIWSQKDDKRDSFVKQLYFEKVKSEAKCGGSSEDGWKPSGNEADDDCTEPHNSLV